MAMTAWSAKVSGDLAFGEWAHLGAADDDDANHLAVAHQGHAEFAADAMLKRRTERVLWVRTQVINVHGAPFESHTPGERAPVWQQRGGLDRAHPVWDGVVGRDQPIAFLL